MSTALQKKNMKKYKKSILITALTVFIILLFFALYAPLVIFCPLCSVSGKNLFFWKR